MIEARDVGVQRAGIWSLRHVDVRVERGEILGLIGPPSAGKTLLLKSLAALVRLDAGTLFLDNLAHTRQQQLAWQRRIGFAFQNNALFDALSVFDNVAFPLRRRHIAEPEVQRRVLARLDEVQLTDARNALPADLSGGMRKRLGLARATVIDPDVGLLDEPFAGLDPQTALHIVGMVVRLTHVLRMATLIVSNDLALLLPVCHRVVMLLDGAVVYDGAPYGLVRSTHPAVVQFATGSDAGPL